MGSLLGGLPRLPRDPRPHLVLGLIQGPGHTQATLSRAFFSNDEADRDSDGEEGPGGDQAVSWVMPCKSHRGLPCTDRYLITKLLPALGPEQP